MDISAKTPEDLGKAIKTNPDKIEISGDMKKKIISIKRTGRILWFFALGAISVGVFVYIGSSEKRPLSLPGPAFGLAPAVAASILGIGAALAAVSMSVAGDGLEVLTRLRKRYVLLEGSGRTWLVKDRK